LSQTVASVLAAGSTVPIGRFAARYFEHPGPPGDVEDSPGGRAELWLDDLTGVLAGAGWRPVPAHVLAYRMSRATHADCPARQVRDGLALISLAAGVPRAGGSWAPEVRPGVYSHVLAWRGERDWLAQVDRLLATPAGEAERRRRQVAADVIVAVARQDAASADYRSGRDVLTSNQTVGVHVGRGPRQVQAARSWLTAMGLQVVVETGRYLTAGERAQAHAWHGGRQTKIASRRACVSSSETPSDGFRRLSTKWMSSSEPSGSENVGSSRAGARARRKQVEPPSMAARRIAAGLAHWCPQTLPGGPRAGALTRLARALDRFGVPARYANTDDLLDALDALPAPGGRAGWWCDPRHVRDPLAYRLGRVKRLMATDPPTPQPETPPAPPPPPLEPDPPGLHGPSLTTAQFRAHLRQGIAEMASLRAGAAGAAAQRAETRLAVKQAMLAAQTEATRTRLAAHRESLARRGRRLAALTGQTDTNQPREGTQP